MKNNLLDIKQMKPMEMASRFSPGVDFLELMLTDKMEEEGFYDLAYEASGAFDRVFQPGHDTDEGDWTDSEAETWEPADGTEFDTDTDPNLFLRAGYVDCMNEAIRFLVEEENISPNHPVVVNLRTHLEKAFLESFRPRPSPLVADGSPPDPAQC